MIGYLDLASGASGDMLLAAIADAGGQDVAAAIVAAVDGLGLGCTVRFRNGSRGGLACTLAEVDVPRAGIDVATMRTALEGCSGAGDRARATAVRALDAIVAAEAAVHGIPTGDVHLHEMGSADTAADLIGAAAGLDALRVLRLHAAPVPVPRGWTRSIPLPAPATLELLRGAPMYGVPGDEELVTPTAAAVLVAQDVRFGTMPPMVLRTVGTGGGFRELERPNVCRLLLGEPAPGPSDIPDELSVDNRVVLECNIDDQTPESLAVALGALLSAGALDAWVTPIVMKKSRPAFQLSVLYDSQHEGAVLRALFANTTALGVRRRQTERWVLDRHEVVVAVGGMDVRVKVASLDGALVTVSPEFDDCAAVSAHTGLAFREVYAVATGEARRTMRR